MRINNNHEEKTIMQKESDSKLGFIKFARVLVYIVYAYLMIAVVTLIFGFTLLLLGASQSSSFVQFVYDLSLQFLQPFRGMFPVTQITDSSYFSASGLFAIIFYSLFAMGIHSLINWLTLKELKHEEELREYRIRQEKLSAKNNTTTAK